MLARVRKLLGRRRAGDRSGRSAGHRGSGPVVEYARILDGDSLWVSVLGADPDAGLGLEPDDGPVVRLVDDAGHDPQDDRLAVRCRLADILPDAPGHGSLVLLDRSDRPAPLSVAADALGEPTLTKVPVSADGRWQHGLEVQRGALTVTRSAAEPAVDLLSAIEQPDAIAVDVRLPATDTTPTLVLLRSKDRELGTVAGEPMPEPDDALPAARPGEQVVRFLVTDDDVPDEPGLAVDVRYEAAGGRLPVRRHHNDLRDPSAGVNHPTLFADDGQETPRLRLRFDDDGVVVLHRAAKGEGS